MTEKTKNRLAYAWLWIWLLIVTVAAGCFYFQFLEEHLNNVANSPMEPEDDAAYGKIAGNSRERCGKSGFQVVPDACSAPYGALSVHLPTSIPTASCAGLADDSWTAPN